MVTNCKLKRYTPPLSGGEENKCLIPDPCGYKPIGPEGTALADLTADYTKLFNNDFERYSKLNDITEYICGVPQPAGMPADEFKRAFHQRCVASKSIKKAIDNYLKIKSHKFNDFDSLISFVRNECHTEGIGLLTTYDFAVRYGWNHGKLLPEKYVYLHSGALIGARRLAALGYIDLPKREVRVSIDLFPEEIKRLGALHAENFLCIYKEQITKLKPKNQQTR